MWEVCLFIYLFIFGESHLANTVGHPNCQVNLQWTMMCGKWCCQVLLLESSYCLSSEDVCNGLYLLGYIKGFFFPVFANLFSRLSVMHFFFFIVIPRELSGGSHYCTSFCHWGVWALAVVYWNMDQTAFKVLIPIIN